MTILLGMSFTAVQAYEYGHATFTFGLNHAMLQPLTDAAHMSLTVGMGNLTAIYGTTFFMATGFHGAHVIIGTTFLIVCLARAIAGHLRRRAISDSKPPPGIGISSTWCGCSCSPASMCGGRAQSLNEQQRSHEAAGGALRDDTRAVSEVRTWPSVPGFSRRRAGLQFLCDELLPL